MFLSYLNDSIVKLLNIKLFYLIMAFGFMALPFKAEAKGLCLKFLKLNFHQHKPYELVYFEGRDIKVNPIPIRLPPNNNVVVAESSDEFNFDGNLQDIYPFGNNFASQIRDIERKPKLIARSLQELGFNREHKLNTLVYPSAGYDAATAFLLWPEITRVVGIDDHPFARSNIKYLAPDPYISHYDKELGYTMVMEVDSKEYMAEVILARLISAFPKIRFKAVYQITDYTLGDYESVRLSHGLILFDTGDGTPIRSYVHLESPTLNGYERKSTFWWRENILNQGFQVLIRKAAMSFYGYPIGLELIGHLKTNHGLLIDGDNDTSSFLSYDYSEQLFGVPRIKIPVARFGYSSYTQLYVF